MTIQPPQIWTTEPLAVRGLAGLAAAHPDAFAQALHALGVPILGTPEVASVITERGRADFVFTSGGQKWWIEAKVDDAVSGHQLDGYRSAADADTRFILLVMDTNSPDCTEATGDRTEWLFAISWAALLDHLIPTNAVAGTIKSDLARILAMPSSKGKQRAALVGIAASLRLPPGFSAALNKSGVGWPVLDIKDSSTPGLVFGQISGQRDRTQPLTLTAHVGILASREEEWTPGHLEHRAMVEALELAAEMSLEHAQFDAAEAFASNPRASKISKMFSTSQAWMARGFKNDYVGIKTRASSSPDEVAAWASHLTAAFAAATARKWPATAQTRPGVASQPSPDKGQDISQLSS